MDVIREDGAILLKLSQHNPPTPGQARKKAKLIPVKWQIIEDDGKASPQRIDLLGDAPISIRCEAESAGKGTPSVFQDFSAPVILQSNLKTEDHLRLMAFDKNAFNRWESGQTIARDLLSNIAKALQSDTEPAIDPALRSYVRALNNTLEDESFNAAFKALALTPPSESEIIQQAGPIDPVAVSHARDWLLRAIGDGLRENLVAVYAELADRGPFSPSAAAAGNRALRNRCLTLLAARQDAKAAQMAMRQFKNARNMTNESAALMTLMQLGGRRVDKSLQDFYEKWKHKPLVIDKWFSMVASRKSKDPVRHVNYLLQHPAYDPRNPNRVRALIGGFALGNTPGFHHLSGRGYQFFTDQVLDMDSRNPQVAARLLGIYEVWRQLDPTRQDMIKSQLQAVLDAKPSKNVIEIASKTLG